MPNYHNLVPGLRCLVLIGTFFQKWGALEWHMGVTIKVGLKLDMTGGLIVTRNLSLSEKIKVLKSLVHTLLKFHGDVDNYKKTINGIGKMVEWRNRCAHEEFIPDGNGDGVKFLAVKAAGEVAMPTVCWSVSDFEGKFAQIASAMVELAEMTDALTDYHQQMANAPKPNLLRDALSAKEDPDPTQ
jgi:hypothetical protein